MDEEKEKERENKRRRGDIYIVATMTIMTLAVRSQRGPGAAQDSVHHCIWPEEHQHTS